MHDTQNQYKKTWSFNWYLKNTKKTTLLTSLFFAENSYHILRKICSNIEYTYLFHTNNWGNNRLNKELINKTWQVN